MALDGSHNYLPTHFSEGTALLSTIRDRADHVAGGQQLAPEYSRANSISFIIIGYGYGSK